MNPSPSPIPVTVVAPPPEWWQIVAALSPFAVLIGAIVAGIIGFRQIKQKREADNRAEWWKRTQWALDAVYSGDDRLGTVGLKVLTVLAGSELAGKGELEVLEAAWENPLSDAEEGQPTESLEPEVERTRAGLLDKLEEAGVPESTQSQLPEAIEGTRIPLNLDASWVPVERAGVDDEPAPRDNEEDDRPQPTGGGTR